MGLGPHDEGGEEKVPRPPQFSDLTRICRELNRLGAHYVVIGGFAIIHHGFPRLTYDIDLLVETTTENEERVIQALLIPPDQAARELKPGEIGKYGVVRVGDEMAGSAPGSLTRRFRLVWSKNENVGAPAYPVLPDGICGHGT